MKTLNLFLYTLLVMFIGINCSCSSDETLISDDNEKNDLPPLTANISLEDIETRGNLSMAAGNKVKYRWFEDDILWAYYASENWYNKLYPTPGNKKDYGNTRMYFSTKSDETVKYSSTEPLIIILSGDKYGNNIKPGESQSDVLTFNRYPIKSNPQVTNIDDNALAITAGNDANRFTTSGNPYFLMATCCSVSETGQLSEYETGGTGSINVRGYIPLLRVNIPAADNVDAQELSKLNYTITMTLKEGENEGYPKQIKLKFLPSNNLTKDKVFEYADNPIVWDEKPLTITLKADAEKAVDKSATIWNCGGGENADYEGHIYLPFPAREYSKITVAIKVEAPESVTDGNLVALCKTYTYTAENIDGIKLDLGKNNANAYYNIGDIWTRTSSTSSSAPAKVKASNGWVVTENE